MMVALSFNEDIVPLTSSSKQSAPLNLFLECAYVDRFRRLNWRSLNKRNRDSELETFHSLILWTSTALQRQQQLLLVQLLELPLELLINLYNVLIFILTLATPETNARSKPGGTKQSTRM